MPHLLTYKIKDAWRKRQVIVALFLDIEGAFPNTVTDKLIHSMCKQGIPDKINMFVEDAGELRHNIMI